MSFAAGKLRVLIATTNGPVEVQLLTEEDSTVGRCVACIGGTTETADIAAAYHAFVVRPTGVIEGRFGHSCYRLDVSGRIDSGSSWQLGVLAAHALLAAGRLAQENDVADGILWVTGSVRPVDLTVGPVNHVSEKLVNSLGRLAQERLAGRRVLVAVPSGNAADITPAIARELLIQGITLVTPSQAHALFDALEIKLPNNSAKGSSPSATPSTKPASAPPANPARRRIPVAVAVLLVAAAVAAPFAFKWMNDSANTSSQKANDKQVAVSPPSPPPAPAPPTPPAPTQATPAPATTAPATTAPATPAAPPPAAQPEVVATPSVPPAPRLPEVNAAPRPVAGGCTYYRVNTSLLNVSKEAGGDSYIDVLEDGAVACITRDQTVNGDDWGYVSHKIEKTNIRTPVDGWSPLRNLTKLAASEVPAAVSAAPAPSAPVPTPTPTPTATPAPTPPPAAVPPTVTPVPAPGLGSTPVRVDETLRFDQPIPFGPYPVNGRSLKQLIEGEPLFPPVEGLDEAIWKKSCTACHQWTPARLCEQGTNYVKTPRNALRVPHPYGGPEKIALMRWVKSGCL